MSKQTRKYAIGMAGEFLVAGELLRRGVPAAVTYGNAKSADVVAYHMSRATTLEVKSTSETKWVLGGNVPEDSEALWVLVFLPVDERQPPQYYVLSSAELRALVLPRHEAYNERYRHKHGKEYSAKGVVSIFRKEVGEQHLGAWQKVMRAVGV